MKKILSIVALALFLGAGVIGCGGASTTGGAPAGTGAPKGTGTGTAAPK